MTWFKTDDGYARHPKTRRAGPKGHNLWHMTGVELAREDADGFIDPFMLADSYGPLAWLPGRKYVTVAAKLVEVGMWHDATTVSDCARCSSLIESGPDHPGRTPRGKLADGWHYMHDWQDFNLDREGKTDPLHRKAEKRRKDLNRRAEPMRIKAAVQERDKNMCRYCGVRVRFGGSDQRSDTSGQIDHVDPMDFKSGPAKDGNSMANCVVACRKCNNEKGQRTPEQWVDEDPTNGKLLLPQPGARRTRSAQGTEPRPDPDRTQTEPGPDPGPGSPSRDARLGAGPDPGSVRAGSERAHDRAGPPDGPGPGRSGPPDEVLVGTRSHPTEPATTHGGSP